MNPSEREALATDTLGAVETTTNEDRVNPSSPDNLTGHQNSNDPFGGGGFERPCKAASHLVNT